MSFRARLLVAFTLAAVLPLGLFGWGARRQTEARMEREFRRRAEAMATVIREDLRREGASVRRRLAAVEERMAGDNLLRLALRGEDRAPREHLLDFASEVMPAAGLDALQLLGPDGRVLSSGHFRNAYGRRLAGLGQGVAEAPDGVALATLDRPEGPFLALVAARRVRMGGRTSWLVGGLGVRERLLPRLSREAGVRVTLQLPEADRDTSRGQPRDTVVLDRVTVPHYRTGSAPEVERASAAFVVAHTLAPLRRLRADTERWLLWGLGGSAALAMLLAWWTAARISRPLEALAADARRLRLDRGDVHFDRGRRDEIGELARTLDETARRLRSSAARLKDAERRATIGEIARQVNHDIRNGLAPLRNVLRHLGEVARDAPERLDAVFRDRHGTLDAALSYLEQLAGQYERISSRSRPRPCDVNDAVRDVAEGADPAGDRVGTELTGDLPPVSADPVALRRILENLVRNGLEAVEDRHDGRVTVSTTAGSGKAPGDGDETGPGTVRIAVRDNGPGLAPEQRERIFDDFYSTRDEGFGLGLSIVRRLVADLDGTLEVDSEAGRGTVFTVGLPAASRDAAPADDRSGRERPGDGGETDRPDARERAAGGGR